MSAEGISSNVRRIAILVTSLDASAGRQLLMAMPTELARQVRRAMTQLGHVDPEEQRQILSEFRMQALNSAAVSSPAGSASELSDKNSARALRGGLPTEVRGEQPGLAPVGLGGDRYGEGNAARALPAGFPADVGGEEPGLAPFGLGGDRHRAGHATPALPGQLDADTLSVLLRGERATVVAVVLSQLEPQAGAVLLGKLPKPLQREAIVSLSRIGQIDPDAMKAIHEQLASRIADYQHRQADENQSTGRIQELLAAAAPDLRSDWQSTLYQAEPHMAARMGIAPPTTAAAPTSAKVSSTAKTNATASTQANTSTPAVPLAATPARGASMLELLANNVVTTADLRVAKTLATPADERKSKSPAMDQGRLDATSAPLADASVNRRDTRDDAAIEDEEQAHILPFPGASSAASTSSSSIGRGIRFEEILDLPAEQIGEILAAADTDVILYALAGASPAFMKRFMSMLDRADGRALQARLKQLRSINLQDVDAAQRRLCELASMRRMANAA